MTTIEGLKALLANTYSLASQTHMAHWNIVGPQFAAMHKLLGNQYDDLYEASDAIAEFIRSTDNNAFSPGGLSPLARLSRIREMTPALLSCQTVVKGLNAGHSAIIEQCKMLGEEALKRNDQDTANFLAERSTAHKKMKWMLDAAVR